MVRALFEDGLDHYGIAMRDPEGNEFDVNLRSLARRSRRAVRAALSTGHQVTADWRLPRSPSLLWPSDRSWLLAPEIDFDSTLVGGSAQLAEELLQATRLEAWPVGIDDDLTIDGDRINQ